MIRSILVREIFIKASTSRIGTGDDNAALTLMSTDMERIRMGFRTLHEIWASLLQVALAGWMLYNRLGIVFVAPIAVVIVCFVGLGILINFTGDSQRSWMAGVQKRVGLTATVIASMKNLKISGLSVPVADFVQRLRVEELAAGARFRRIFILAALLGFTPLLIGPPLAFAFARGTLDASKVFTSLSFLTLLTIPLSQVFQAVPEVISGFACLGRIQAFLERENRDDYREFLEDLQQSAEKRPEETCVSPEFEIIIKNGSFGWQVGKPVLRNVNTEVRKSSLTIVVGPVGSGKSTLCKALLGEVPFSAGCVQSSSRFTHVGFSEQTAFLSNASIRDNIVGFSPFDQGRYEEVIEATALKFDLGILPHGDRTNVGSDGITLSGGQKQRVSLARALYVQSNILILDDIFSGLDADTEERLFRQIFGSNGLLRRRRSTVVLCTHSLKHLATADYIIVLGDGTIIEQGTFSDLTTSQGYLQRLGFKEYSDSNDSSGKSASEANVQDQESMPANTVTSNAILFESETDRSRQIGDKTVYKHYIKSVGLVLAVCSGFFAVLWGFFVNFPTICKFRATWSRIYH